MLYIAIGAFEQALAAFRKAEQKYVQLSEGLECKFSRFVLSVLSNEEIILAKRE